MYYHILHLTRCASSFQPSVPVPYVKEMKDAGQFYTNRVLKDWKEK
jgi:adenylyl cyclase-associated protein